MNIPPPVPQIMVSVAAKHQQLAAEFTGLSTHPQLQAVAAAGGLAALPANPPPWAAGIMPALNNLQAQMAGTQAQLAAIAAQMMELRSQAAYDQIRHVNGRKIGTRDRLEPLPTPPPPPPPAAPPAAGAPNPPLSQEIIPPGPPPAGFPTTYGAALELNHARLRALLRAYGLSTVGSVTVCRVRFARFVGYPE